MNAGIHNVRTLSGESTKKAPSDVFPHNTVRGTTVGTAQTLFHNTQIFRERNTNFSYFWHFFTYCGISLMYL